MFPLSMGEQATPGVANAEFLHQNPLFRRPASTTGRLGESDRLPAWQELRVLVVDDDRDLADSLARLVRRSGHAALMAHDGLAALRVAAAQHPDVVLLDMKTPSMDGHEVASHLRRDFPRRECIIIALTERSEHERRQQSTASGIDWWLIKPLDPLVVETLLLECEHVNRSQALRADDKRNCYETGGSSC